MAGALTIPNQLTILRIALIPLLILVCYGVDGVLSHRLAAGLFVLASVTDFLDGYLARLWRQQSDFGRFFDNIADKLLVAAIIVLLVDQGKADAMPAIAIIGREILVSGLREFLSSLRISLPVTRLSKAKTGLQMVAITSLLLGDKGAGFPGVEWLGHGCLWLAAGLTLVTGYAYCRATWHHLRLGLPPSPSQP